MQKTIAIISTSTFSQEHEPQKFATGSVPSSIPGAECLLLESAKQKRKTEKKDEPSDDEEDLTNQDGEESDSEDDEDDGLSDIEEMDEEIDELCEDDLDDSAAVESTSGQTDAKRQRLDENADTSGLVEEKTQEDTVQDLLCSGQILDDTDFRRIQKFQLRKHAMSVAEAKRRRLDHFLLFLFFCSWNIFFLVVSGIAVFIYKNSERTGM